MQNGAKLVKTDKETIPPHYDEIIPTTQEDGTVEEFKMRYFDIRFSNICNFKCRTCGSEFSSQWGAEMQKNFDPKHPIVIHVDDGKGSVLEEVLTHIEHIDLAYFAGGEPLIMPEHYNILKHLYDNTPLEVMYRKTSESFEEFETRALHLGMQKHKVQ